MDRPIRIGKVSSIDYANGLVKVTYPDLDETVTDDLPYATFNDEYQMPPIDSDVLVVHLSNGQAAGICLGTYWNTQNTPHGSGAGYYRKDFNSNAIGEAFLIYLSGMMSLNVKDFSLNLEGNLSVDASTINLSAGSININSGKDINLTANGEITFKSAAGSITLSEIIQHIK